MVMAMARKRETAADKLARQMQLLWQEHRAEFIARVDIIESAHASLAGGSHLNFAERVEAASSAHKLAGVLGMFGLQDGTQAARNIENLLTTDDTHSAAHLAAQLRPNITALRAAIVSR